MRDSRAGGVSVRMLGGAAWRETALDIALSWTANAVARDGGQRRRTESVSQQWLWAWWNRGSALGDGAGGWCGMGDLRDLVSWGVAGKVHDCGQPQWVALSDTWGIAAEMP